jgi:hypothetical protein
LPEAQGDSCVIIRLRITKATAAVDLLGEDRASTFARVEAATAGCAVSVAGARTGNELRSSTGAGGRGSSGRAGWCLGGGGGSGRGRGSSGRAGWCLEAQRDSCIVIRLRITKATASVDLLGDNRTRTFARVEAAAAVCAVGVAGAWTSNELCALTDDQKSH